MPTVDEDVLLAEGLIALGLAVERLRVELCRELALTPQQVQLVCALGHGPRTTGGLAALLGCDKTNITGLVDRLEPRGLLRRERDGTDRRVVHIALTEAGAGVVDEFRRRAASRFTGELAAWSRREQRDLTEVTRKAVRALGPDLLDVAEH